MIKSPKSYCFSDRPCRECRPLSCALLPTLRSIFLTTQKGSHRRCVCRSAWAIYRQLKGMCPPMPSGKSTAVSGQTVYATHCPGHSCDHSCFAMPFAVSSGQATCKPMQWWLKDYSSESRLFDLSAIISNATLSSCVRPPCVHFDAKNTGGLVVWLAPVFSNIFCNEI